MKEQKCCVKNCKKPGMKHMKHGKEIFLQLCKEHSDWMLEALHRYGK